jgi:hypothetical protein
MKKPLGLFCLLLLWYPPLEAQNNHEGLLNKLIETKYRTELYLITHCNNQNQKDSALATYNMLRWKIDGLVYQLSADMIAHNNPRKLKLLNNWCLINKSNSSIETYIYQIIEIEKIFNGNIIAPSEKNKTLNLTTNVFYLLKDSWTILNGLSDIKTQRTMALVNLLDQTRLSDPLIIIKQIK